MRRRVQQFPDHLMLQRPDRKYLPRPCFCAPGQQDDVTFFDRGLEQFLKVLFVILYDTQYLRQTTKFSDGVCQNTCIGVIDHSGLHCVARRDDFVACGDDANTWLTINGDLSIHQWLPTHRFRDWLINRLA